MDNQKDTVLWIHDAIMYCATVILTVVLFNSGIGLTTLDHLVVVMFALLSVSSGYILLNR